LYNKRINKKLWGVDYTGNYGIGVRVLKKEFEEESEYCGDFNYYLEEALDSTEYYYFETGSEMYSGGENEIYICISEPFKDGYNIAERALDLYSFLAEKEIEYVGKVDEVGGLLID
jgi:hypothetical protein